MTEAQAETVIELLRAIQIGVQVFVIFWLFWLGSSIAAGFIRGRNREI